MLKKIDNKTKQSQQKLKRKEEITMSDEEILVAYFGGKPQWSTCFSQSTGKFS